ncbi:AT-hook motif nuclear-localized protein 11-like [Triticum aestivum]|uniref:AT-hook motif nuclear-localized protein 11-like n=1 Tax=Triticum aestivum TaxID=4565 RepID=UPI001D018153|nr:AT-hook motif nuclear-localized protein 11-like [Triticum aestivum]
MMPQHAYGEMPPGSANVMHGMPLAFNPMHGVARAGVSQAAMKPADMSPLAMYRPDSTPPGMPQPVSGGGGALMVSVSGSGGELVIVKKRGRPRKYGTDGTMGSAVKAEAGGQSGGASANSNPDGKRRGRPPGSGKKKQLDVLGSAGTSFTPHIITVKPNEVLQKCSLLCGVFALWLILSCVWTLVVWSGLSRLPHWLTE